jgi:hypothetical protein
MNRAIDIPAEHVQVEGAGSITIHWQTDESEKESGEAPELSEDENPSRPESEWACGQRRIELMVEEIVCEDCRRVFYDWWDVGSACLAQSAPASNSGRPTTA